MKPVTIALALTLAATAVSAVPTASATLECVTPPAGASGYVGDSYSGVHGRCESYDYSSSWGNYTYFQDSTHQDVGVYYSAGPNSSNAAFVRVEESAWGTESPWHSHSSHGYWVRLESYDGSVWSSRSIGVQSHESSYDDPWGSGTSEELRIVYYGYDSNGAYQQYDVGVNGYESSDGYAYCELTASSWGEDYPQPVPSRTELDPAVCALL